MATKCRTGLKNDLVLIIGLGVADFELGAVRSQASTQACSQTGAEVTANVRCTNQEDFRLPLHDNVNNNLSVSIGGVLVQHRRVAYHHLVCAVAANLSSKAVNIVAKQQAAQLYAQLVGQLAAFGDQLERCVLEHALALLAEDPYALEFINSSIVKHVRIISFRLR